MPRPASRRTLRLIRFSLAQTRNMRSTDGTQDAPSTGRGRWLDQRLVVEPELLRLDYELEREDGRGLQGMKLIWVHSDSRLSGATETGSTTLSN